MLRLLGRVQLAYVGLFLAACVGILFYEAHYVWPVQRCEGHGGWWSARYHECATPVPIWQLTGRIPQGTRPIAQTPIPIAKPLTLPTVAAAQR
jgi:hypothetical protein